VTDWRDDEADEAEFDKGFFQFIKDRKIKTYKRGGQPEGQETREIEPKD
jgi:hypothetical protein